MISVKNQLIILAFSFSCNAYNASCKVDQSLEKPNILILSIEDISPYAFSMYGNNLVTMPALQRLSDEGITFDNASSVSPYCSPSRSTIICGSYATTYGTDVHRGGRIVPEQQYFFPILLKEAGYFTTNNEKTDYNIDMGQWNRVKNMVWSECSNTASYNSENRKNGQPFFAVFNNLVTHWSRLNSIDTSYRQPLQINPKLVKVPSFVPDIPEIRNGLAWHYQKAEQASDWVDVFLKDLESQGLLEKTIIFFFSDHGGVLPRSKGFGYHVGTKVPFIVRIPENYRHLFPEMRGSRSQELVDFTDIGPTILSLVGIKPPEHMQGKALWGDFFEQKDSLQFNFRTNNAHHFAPSRSSFDGRYRYTRFFVPYKPDGLRQDYQFKLPELLAYDSLHLNGQLDSIHELNFLAKPNEVLFDLREDPDELNNLANDPAYTERLKGLRAATKEHMKSTSDLGLFPMSARSPGKDISLYKWVRENAFPVNELIESAWKAIEKDSFLEVSKYLDHQHESFRFWAVVAVNNAAKKGWIKTVPQGLYPRLEDVNDEIRAATAEALYELGEREMAIEYLRKELLKANLFAYSALEETGQAIDALIPEIMQMAMDENYKVRFYARSLLIDAGELPYGELLEKQDYKNVAETFDDMQNHLKWMP